MRCFAWQDSSLFFFLGRLLLVKALSFCMQPSGDLKVKEGVSLAGLHVFPYIGARAGCLNPRGS